MQSNAIVWLRSAAHVLLVPPGLLILILAAGLTLLPHAPKAGRRLAWAGTILLYALCLSPVSSALTHLAGNYSPLRVDDAHAAQAIVVLAGEARFAPEENAEDTVGDLTLVRLRYGVLLAKRTGLPMLFTGGAGGLHRHALATLMQRTAVGDYGIAARWLETGSRNTRENAQLSAPMLRAAGVQSIVLVTDDNHMRRAEKEFAATGLHVIPAPVRIPGPVFGEPWWGLFRPSLGAFRDSSLAIYELMGQAAQLVSPPPREVRVAP